jgi:heme exporter protein D
MLPNRHFINSILTDEAEKSDYNALFIAAPHSRLRAEKSSLRSNSVNQAFARRARSHLKTSAAASHRAQRARMPSSHGYMLASGAAAAALFFILWWMLNSSGDEAPWVPAGLAASVVMLVAVAAREVVMRRAWARYILENDRREQATSEAKKRNSVSSGASAGSSSGSRTSRLAQSYSAQFRTLQKQSADANAPGALPEAHLETYISCQEYLESADDALRSGSIGNESRITLRAGQERARSLARQHLLNWARGTSRALTTEAQQRVRLSDKIETARRALDVIDSALNLYPDEAELRESESAVREFIASVKVSHWVELAERAAFKGYYARAIDRYRDALFYLSRENMKEETRAETAAKIGREIELLRARLKTRTIAVDPTRRDNGKRSGGTNDY